MLVAEGEGEGEGRGPRAEDAEAQARGELRVAVISGSDACRAVRTTAIVLRIYSVPVMFDDAFQVLLYSRDVLEASVLSWI